MTVYVHNVLTSVGYGGEDGCTHFPDGERPADALDDERTWAFRCRPDCEDRIIRDVEYVGRTPGGVPLTAEEKAVAEHLERAANKDVQKMAMALSALVKDQVTGISA